ncbi:hypothetical protein T05_4204 [Trichinella murrelli]|uniref:Uncharacterized protein n=1 Tax=Trichinella murrelli TaxID=144512 RepID=A0A0V0SRH3_9BILA|nr:hypothetical protein T05_4204 [Trichinella murrelli]
MFEFNSLKNKNKNKKNLLLKVFKIEPSVAYINFAA